MEEAVHPSEPAAPPERWQFASDNVAGIHPAAWAAMAKAGEGFAPPYGTDAVTEQASDLIREVFETDCEVFFVFNGTAANSLALSSLCASYHSAICHEAAHVETDECGAPEFFSNGTKILTAPGPAGRLDPAAVEHLITRRSDIHYPRARALSLSQPTEFGTCYRPDDIRDLCGLAREHGLRIHMDGARFAHAVVELGTSPAEISWKAGVDVLCLGGTKLGIGTGEAILFFDPGLAAEFEYRCKQAGQLASKMRYLAAPWLAMLTDGLWLEAAAHANHCARLLADRISSLPDIQILHPVEANSVFLQMPEHVHTSLRAQGWQYYVFIGGGARFMCSWATREEDIEELAASLARAVGA